MRAIVTNSLSALGERRMKPLLRRLRCAADAQRAFDVRGRGDEEEVEEEEERVGAEGAWRTRT